MQDSLNILKVCTRALSAFNRKATPDPQDVEALRNYLGSSAPEDADQLAYAAIIRMVDREHATKPAKKSGSLATVYERYHPSVAAKSSEQATCQKINLFGREFFPVAFPLDQVNCSHYETLGLAPQDAESKGKGAKKIALPPSVRQPRPQP